MDLITATLSYVQLALAEAEAGHDWQHIKRVWQMSKAILSTEPSADPIVVELAALLHDIADSKFTGGDETIGPKMAADFLHDKEISPDQLAHVLNIITYMSFKNSLEDQQFDSLEMRIVQDADKIDALGAIGIARTFHYGGYKNQAIYDPNIPVRTNLSKKDYKTGVTSSINHFYEKLLLLKDMMHTDYAKKEAQKRHDFLLLFLDQFMDEWQ